MNDTDQKTGALKTYMAVGRDAVFIVAVLLYYVGFLYFYSYNNRFGISVTLGDVPVYQLFVYSYIVFSGFWWILLILAVLVFVLLAVHVGFLQNLREGAKPEDAAGFVLLAFLIVLMSVILMGFLAETKGSDDADHIRSATIFGCAKFGRATFASPITFLFTDTARRRYPHRVLAANDSGRLQLIYETADSYYVALHECPSRTVKSAIDSASVFALQKRDVTMYGVKPPA